MHSIFTALICCPEIIDFEGFLRHVKICDFYGCEFAIRKHRKMHGMQREVFAVTKS